MHKQIDTYLPDVFFETSEVPKCPSPTLLYPLSPYSVGTGNCESLRSYICRLADAHRISVFALITLVFGKNLFSCKRVWDPDMKISNNSLPMGWHTNKAASVLADATSVNSLYYCTMAPLQDIFGRNQLFTNKDRHCPQCLNEGSQKSRLYGRLIWDIACINTCPSHGVQFESSSCEASSDAHLKKGFRKTLSGVCRDCGSIGYQCKPKKLVIASDMDYWKANQVAEVIASIPNATVMFSPKSLHEGLTLLVQSFTEGKAAIAARHAGIPKSILWEWLNKKYPPTLGHLLNLCMAAEVSLLSVISGKPVSCKSPRIHQTLKEHRMPKPTTEEREKTLRNALEVTPPPSLLAVARALTLDKSILRRNFPELSSIIVNRYRQYRVDKKNQHHESMRQFGLKVIKELKTRRLPLTARNIRDESGHSFGERTVFYQVVTAALTEQQNNRTTCVPEQQNIQLS
jgi:hypothetical protein